MIQNILQTYSSPGGNVSSNTQANFSPLHVQLDTLQQLK